MISTKKVATIVAATMLTSNALPPLAIASNLYGELQKVDGKYVYSSISDNAGGNYAANIESMTKAGAVRPSSGCMNFIFGLAGDCYNTDDFYKSHFDFGATLMGYGATMGLMPVFTLFGVFGNKDVFDAEAFTKACQEATINSGVNVQQAIDKYDDYLKTANQLTSKYIDYGNTSYSKLDDKYLSKYNIFYDSLRLNPKLIDDSGFNKDENLLNALNRQVKITKNPLPSRPLTSKTYYSRFSSEPSKIFSTLDGLITSAQAQFEADLSKLNKDVAQYEEELKTGTKDVKIVHSSQVKVGEYTIDISVPETVEYSNNVGIPVRYVIKSKDFHSVFPRYSNEDNNIKVVSDGKDLRIVNKTKGFVQIKTVSVYYNNDISTFSFPNALELAPEATKTGLSLADLCNGKVASDAEYPEMTAATAKKVTLNYGLAVKYSIIDQNIDKTLYSNSSYNLYKVLSAI